MGVEYICSKCGLGVIVVGVEYPIKACKCDAPINANCTATLYGKSSLTED